MFLCIFIESVVFLCSFIESVVFLCIFIESTVFLCIFVESVTVFRVLRDGDPAAMEERPEHRPLQALAVPEPEQHALGRACGARAGGRLCAGCLG